jgi:hypothetical protein
MMLVGRCDGNRSPASHMAYFHAVQVVLISPFLKINLGPLRQEDAPSGLDVGARLVEGRRTCSDRLPAR